MLKQRDCYRGLAGPIGQFSTRYALPSGLVAVIGHFTTLAPRAWAVEEGQALQREPGLLKTGKRR